MNKPVIALLSIVAIHLAFSLLLLQHRQLHAEAATTHQLDWKVQYANYTRLCHTKALVTINGQYPGPTVYVREGDTVIVKITNLVAENITIHWHGVRQVLSAWADGPAYITQCPIQTGNSYVHKFQIIDQRGTLFWHAHISWLRATVHGAFIILPQQNVVYPFTAPNNEIPVLVGEWWNDNVEDVIAQALQIGGGSQVSDALTINGQPGALYDCSLADTPVFNVVRGRRYLLRIINTALSFQFFVGVANHTLTVVEVDAEYTLPYQTDVVVVAPGQTTNVLFTANQPTGQYFISATVFSAVNPAVVPYPTRAATAILRYNGASTVPSANLPMPSFPAVNDIAFAAKFAQSLRGQSYSRGFYYYNVPQTVDENLFFTVGFALQPCSTCSGPIPANRFSASINNVTFSTPSVSLLQAYYNHINGVYTTDFPDTPLFVYNYTGVDPSNMQSVVGTKVKVLEFGTNVQIVLQDTATLGFESHPIHLHGQNFYIVGTGFGTFNASSDPKSFNLVNPPSRNTVAVPFGGWAAVRFRTTNPGVWFMHCHLDLHASWGMSMAFIVKNGRGSDQILPPPPTDLPPC